MNRTECLKIHEASLSLLENPGIKLEHDEICSRMLRAGAQPGDGAQVVRIPRRMVDEYLALAPKSIPLTDRAGGRIDMTIDTPPIFWTCPGMAIERNGETREFTSADMAAVAKLVDSLENVHGVFGLAMADVPPAARDFVGLRVMAQNTRKHIRALCFTPRGSQAMIEMQPVLGDHPWFSIGFTAHGPLRWTNLALDIFLRSAGHGIPVTINGEPMCGATGPVTIAGALAVGNAEILAGIVLNQVIEPGRPCIHNLGLAHVMDMRQALAVTGGPENALMAAAAADLGRFYGIPSCSWVSTEALCVDAQAACETMFGIFTHARAGVNLIWGIGQLESEISISPAKLVVDNEMISYAKRFLRGFAVNDETLALDVIRQVGICGSFLDTDHTLMNFREHLYHPRILCRDRRANWRAAGAMSLTQVALEKADEIIAAPAEPIIDEQQLKALMEIERKFMQ
jgi:trimethylamine---corrinoid protein Co-methyltransferase